MINFIIIMHFYIIIVRPQFVTTHNNVGFARKKAQTISFIKCEFERLGLGHQTVVFLWCSYTIKSCSLQESFSWRQAGRLQFLAIFPSPLLGASTFTLYSPSQLILAFQLLIRQVPTSVPVPSTAPLCFLLVARIEVTLFRRLFSLT